MIEQLKKYEDARAIYIAELVSDKPNQAKVEDLEDAMVGAEFKLITWAADELRAIGKNDEADTIVKYWHDPNFTDILLEAVIRMARSRG